MHLAVSNHSTEPDLVLEAGTIVDSRYRLDAVLGSGAMGTVYRGVHLSVGRPIALKVLSADLAASSTFRTRFRAEARAASAAGHPNIIEVFDAGELPDGRPYLVMEQLSGRDLLEELRLHGPMTLERACRIVREVARALHAAHEVGIIHRDLKAENVFLVQRDEHESVKVLDFGIAHGGIDGQRVTTPGLAMGTPEYMAPEQAFGAAARPTFDIYALGVLLFELLVGEPPFVANNPMEVLGKKTSNPAPSLRTRRRDLPDALVELVDACLEIEPGARPQSAEIVAHRLDAISFAANAPPSAKKRLLETWVVVVSLAVVGLGAAGVSWTYAARDTAPAEAVEPVVEPVEPEPIEEIEEIPPETVEAIEPEPVEEIEPIEEMVAALDPVEVPLPQVRPEPPKEEVKEKPKEKPRRKPEPVKAKPKPSAPATEQRRAQVQTQREAPRAAAQQNSSGASSSVSPARWQARVASHLERRKRYPSAARKQGQQGTAQVRFTIDGSGNVQSVSLVRSSGVPLLDEEVVALVRRASPVPAPPPGVNRTIVVPIRFSMR